MAALSRWTSDQWAYYVGGLLRSPDVFVQKQNVKREKVVLAWGSEVCDSPRTIIDAESLLSMERGQPLRTMLLSHFPVLTLSTGFTGSLEDVWNKWGLRPDGTVSRFVLAEAEIVFRSLQCYMEEVIDAMFLLREVLFQTTFGYAVLVEQTDIGRLKILRPDKSPLGADQLLQKVVRALLRSCFVTPPCFLGVALHHRMGNTQTPVERVAKAYRALKKFQDKVTAFDSDWVVDTRGGFGRFLKDYVESVDRTIYDMETPPTPPIYAPGTVLTCVCKGQAQYVEFKQCIHEFNGCLFNRHITRAYRVIGGLVEVLDDVVHSGLQSIPENVWLSLVVWLKSC